MADTCRLTGAPQPGPEALTRQRVKARSVSEEMGFADRQVARQDIRLFEGQRSGKTSREAVFGNAER